MDKIKPKIISFVKESVVDIYPNGVISKPHVEGEVDISGIRGRPSGARIREFSYHSRQRMREFMVKHSIPGSRAFGLTLTLPDLRFLVRPDDTNTNTQSIKANTVKKSSGKMARRAKMEGRRHFSSKPDCAKRHDEFSSVVARFPDTIDRFSTYFKREFPKSGYIWRAELQQRGAPHLHILVYVHDSDFPRGPFERLRGVSADAVLLRFALAGLWVRAVGQTVYASSAADLEIWLADYLDHGKGFDVEELADRGRLLRYISDHASKHKREQLGYKGKQWGVCRKSQFQPLAPIRIDCDRAQVLARRLLGHLNRYRIRKPRTKSDPWGVHLTPYKPALGVSFAGSDTLLRIRDYCLQRAADYVPPSPPDWPADCPPDSLPPPCNIDSAQLSCDTDLTRLLFDADYKFSSRRRA